MAKKALKAALVGVGVAGQVGHIPAWKKLENVELVALCDRDIEKATRVAQRFGVPHATSNFEDVLGDSEIDLVDVCTPNFLHAPLTIAALESGKHVLVERPIARTELYVCDEMFLCGTGAEVTPVRSVDRRPIADGQVGPITAKLAKRFEDVTRGRVPERRDWVTPVW